MHREEVRLVAELGDELELVLELIAHPGGHAAGPDRGGAFLHLPAQPLRRGVTVADALERVLVAQLVEREATALGDRHAFFQQRDRMQPRQARARTQVTLAVGRERVAGGVHRGTEPDRGERVGQCTPPARVHAHIAGRDPRQPGRVGKPLEPLQARALGRTQDARHRDPAAPGKGPRQPVPVGHRIGGARIGLPQHQAAGRAGFQIGARQAVLALGRSLARARDQAGQPRVAGAIGRQQHEAQAAVELEFAADDEMQPAAAGRHVRAHRAGERALVGQRQRAVAEIGRALDQLLRVRGPVQKAEVRRRPQLGVGRCGLRDRGGQIPFTSPAYSKVGRLASFASQPAHRRQAIHRIARWRSS